MTQNNPRQHQQQIEPSSIRVPGLVVREQPRINRIQFIFDEQPGEDICRILKNHAFRWSRHEDAWQRQLSVTSRKLAVKVLLEIQELAKAKSGAG
ncbi:hypothetical protein [Pseudovibrio brasiliensis]|uniref:Uncharacterized protein n=1 Tax=Pseudovibrio brasiliensis TaxID=1898042 RepID=A0ABX8ATP6_9HYPH|nr:hypothetical protein [Pseudovibrio brasiliensis]QUS58443.1 hypothetical protein KGB56_22200 [Pseudovibrio brasiliensis]